MLMTCLLWLSRGITSRLCWTVYQCAVSTLASPSAVGKQRLWHDCHHTSIKGRAYPAVSEVTTSNTLVALCRRTADQLLWWTPESASPPRPFVLCAVPFWYQSKLKTCAKLCNLNAAVLPTLLYVLESLVLLEPQIYHLQVL